MSLDSILRSVGKNLLNSNNISSSQFCTVVSKGDGGAVITSPNNKENEVSIARLLRVTLPAGTYTFSCNFTIENTKNSTRPNEILIFVDNKFIILWNLAKSDGTYAPTRTFTTDKESEITISWYFNVIEYTTADTIAKVTFSNLQLEKSSTATSYEPYHQGPKSITIPSDSKNLIKYPYDTNTTTINGVTFTVNSDGGITVNGTATTTAVFYIKSNFITLKPNKQYTLSGFTSGTGCSLNLHSKDDLQNIGLVEQHQTKTFTAGYEKYYCYLAIGATKTVNATFYPQLEEGITATDYSLNTGNKEVLKISYGSRNLFDITNVTGYQTILDLTYESYYGSVSEDKTVTCRQGAYSTGLVLKDWSKYLKAGTYTISADCYYPTTANTISYLITANLLQVGMSSQSQQKIITPDTWTRLSFTVNITSDGEYYLCIQPVGNAGAFYPIDVKFKNIQLELGNKATKYVPYSREIVWTKTFTTTDVLGNFELGKSVLA